MIWACRAICVLLLALSAGCGGLTIGPVVEKKAIIVHSGTGIEITEDVTVHGHALKPDDKEGPVDTFEVNVGGWIAVHPDHWAALKNEYHRLRVKAGEEK